jgi:AbrB family looped-hinge helix DNA binding protein
MREITASVTDRGQVTIPAEVRKALGISGGEKLVFVIDDGNVTLKKPEFTWRTAFQSVPALKEPKTLEEIDQIVREDRAAEYLRKMSRGQD